MVKIYVQASIKRVADLDTIKQRFYAEIVYKLEWKANEGDLESWEKHCEENDPAMDEWKPTWIPKISFPNSYGAEIQLKSGTPIFFSIKKGMITYNFEIRSDFMEIFELWRFPFDVQDFSIQMKCGNPPGNKEHHLLPSPRSKAYAKIELNNCVFTEWNVFPMMTEFGFTDPKLSKSGHSFPLFIIRLKTQRRYGYYIIRVVSVLSALSLSSLFSFSVPLDERADRFGIDFTLLLTVIAFQYVVVADLPNVSFLTAIDYFMNISIGMILVVTMEHAFVPDTHFGRQLDLLFPFLMLIFWVLWHVATGLYWPYLIYSERKKLTMGTHQLDELMGSQEEPEVFKIPFEDGMDDQIKENQWVSCIADDFKEKPQKVKYTPMESTPMEASKDESAQTGTK